MSVKLIKSRRHIARKMHMCNCCGTPIEKGRLYIRTTYHNDYFYDWVEHLECSKVMDHFYRDMDPNGDGVSSETFANAIEDLFKHYFGDHQNISLRLKVLLLYDKIVEEQYESSNTYRQINS